MCRTQKGLLQENDRNTTRKLASLTKRERFVSSSTDRERQDIGLPRTSLGNLVSEEMGVAGWTGCSHNISDARAGNPIDSSHLCVMAEMLLKQAVQIFNVLRSIGAFHGFSAGLIIGGKNLKDEKDRLARMNILVATPGRLLQHMDQTIGFCLDNLQMLGEQMKSVFIIHVVSFTCSS